MVIRAIFSAYNNALMHSPLSVTSLSSSVCYGAGDYIAQSIEIKQGKKEKIDWHRTAVFATFGLLMGGPTYHMWFNKIEKMPLLVESIVRWNQQRYLVRNFKNQLYDHLKTGNIESMSMKNFRVQFKETFDTIEKPIIRSKTVLCAKILADQFIFSSLYPIFFMVTTGVMLENSTKEDWEYLKENKRPNVEKIAGSFTKAVTNAKDKWFNIYFTDCAVWPMLQMINFAFIPPHLHAIYVNALNIPWNAFLSYASQGH